MSALLEKLKMSSKKLTATSEVLKQVTSFLNLLGKKLRKTTVTTAKLGFKTAFYLQVAKAAGPTEIH